MPGSRARGAERKNRPNAATTVKTRSVVLLIVTSSRMSGPYSARPNPAIAPTRRVKSRAPIPYTSTAETLPSRIWMMRGANVPGPKTLATSASQYA